MTVYCGCGGGEPKPTTTSPSLIEVGSDVISLIAAEYSLPGWLVDIWLTLVKVLVSMPNFCTIVPPEPTAWTLDDFTSEYKLFLKMKAWQDWLLWNYFCRCVDPGGGSSLSVAYGDNKQLWGPTYYYDYNTYGSAGSYYDVYFYLSGVLGSTYSHKEGPIGWMWTLPASEGGSEGTQHSFRLLGHCTVMSYPTLTYTDTIIGTVTDAVFGANLANVTLLIVPEGTCIPVDPSVTDPTTPSGYEPDSGPSCASYTDVCQSVDRLRRMVATLVPLRVGSMVPTTTITMEGDDHASIAADAMVFSTSGIAPGEGYEGTDVPHYPGANVVPAIGWYAFGSESGYYQKQALTWANQVDINIPADASTITWHIRPGVTVTASLYVRTGYV